MAKAKILVVDDEKIVLMAYSEWLESAGFLVRQALNGQEALELAKNDFFNIVYTDLVMPGMNGVEVCKAIKGISPVSEVILISGHPEQYILQLPAFLKAGGRDEILRKPISGKELIKVTKKVLNLG